MKCSVETMVQMADGEKLRGYGLKEKLKVGSINVLL